MSASQPGEGDSWGQVAGLEAGGDFRGQGYCLRLTSTASQAELIVGDQSGAIHIWDLKTDHNEQLIPEPEFSITSAHIDPDASYMAAVNSAVSDYGAAQHLIFCFSLRPG